MGLFSASKHTIAAAKAAFSYGPENIHGRAGFADERLVDAKGLLKRYGKVAGRHLHGIRFGKSPITGRPFRFHGKIRPHILTVGGSGAGKSSAIETVLLEWPYSAIVFDVTGEHAVISHKARERFGPVYQINKQRLFAKELASVRNVRINPMHRLKEGSADLVPRAEDISLSLIPTVEGHNKFWYDSPAAMVTAMLMGQVMYGRPEDRNLPYIVRAIVNGNVQAWASWLLSVCDDPYLRARVQRFLTDPAVLRSVPEFIQTAVTETGFLLDPAVVEIFSNADITFSQFRRRPQTLYVVQSLSEIRTTPKMNKLILGSILSEVFRGDEDGECPLLIICDELPQYGADLAALPAAFAAARKYQTILWGCVGSIENLGSMFEDPESVLSNVGMLQFLDAYDGGNSEFVSKLLGEREVYSLSKSVNYDSQTFGDVPPFVGNADDFSITGNPDLRKLHVTQNYTQHKRAVMTPYEVRNELSLREQIAFVRECPAPIRCDKALYYQTELNKLACPNPFVRNRRAK